jgi:hypothetical protein
LHHAEHAFVDIAGPSSNGAALGVGNSGVAALLIGDTFATIMQGLRLP